MNRLLYFLVVLPLSLLPLPCLNLFKPGIYFLLYRVIRYRKNVVLENLNRSFPEYNTEEIRTITTSFYWHLSSVLIESVKNLSFSIKELMHRVHYANPDLIQQLQGQGRNIILVGGHYGNWEWVITSLGLHFPTNLYGLGMPLSASFWQRKLTERRERFGLKVIHSKNYKEHILDKSNQPFILLMLADQSPGDSRKSYWMEFLNQPTAIAFGTETLANKTDAAVVYFEVTPKPKGTYNITFKLVSEDVKALSFGKITTDYTSLIEQSILKKPYLWMWSHKRWKREIPDDLPALKQAQEIRFNQLYR